MKVKTIDLSISPLALVLIAAAFGFLAAKMPQTTQEYEYVSIMQEGHLTHITIGNTYQRERTPRNPRAFDNRDLFKKIAEFETQGYELTSSQFFASASINDLHSYTLMRRRK